MQTARLTQTVKTLAPASSTSLVAANPRRLYLGLLNTGAADVTLSFTSAPAVAGQGWVLYAGGGGISWDGDTVPTDAIQGIATAGSTLIVLEG